MCERIQQFSFLFLFFFCFLQQYAKNFYQYRERERERICVLLVCFSVYISLQRKSFSNVFVSVRCEIGKKNRRKFLDEGGLCMYIKWRKNYKRGGGGWKGMGKEREKCVCVCV